MIEKEVFLRWMSMFGARFGRVLSQPEMRLYYTLLSAEVDTAGFDAGCTAAFRTAKFWPTVEELLAGAPRTGEAAVERAQSLTRVLEIVNGYAPPTHEGRATRELAIQLLLGPQVLQAYQAAGGFDVFRGLQTPDDALGRRSPGFPFVRKEYLAALSAAMLGEAAGRALKAAQAAGQLSAGDATKLLAGG